MNILCSRKNISNFFVIFVLICLLAVNFASATTNTAQAAPPLPAFPSNESVETSCKPSISFTTVPPIGSTDNLKGRVDCVTLPADNYNVVVYIFVSGGWWIKPYADRPLTPIKSDGTWETDFTHSKNDVLATKLAAFLLPKGTGTDPAILLGGKTIPEWMLSHPHTVIDRRRTIEFSGYTWRVKVTAHGSVEYPYGPGHCGKDSDYNYFSDAESDVWVDGSGLHLTISKKNGKWYNTEILTDDPLGYGIYTITLASPVDQLDPNATLGFFTWDDTVPDLDNREIDIEFSRWGNASDDQNSQYVVQPDHKHRFKTISVPSTHRFTWQSDQVSFISREGRPPDLGAEIASWVYDGSDVPSEPDVPPEEVNAREVNARINLWLNNCSGPSDGQDIEVVVESFDFDAFPSVKSITRLDPNPTSATSVDFKVIFSEAVTGVTADDFDPYAPGITGAAITNVSGSGDTYAVSVNTGSWDGTIRLDLIDNDSIMDGTGNPLGGPGAGI